jgi:hypothetical protein
VVVLLAGAAVGVTAGLHGVGSDAVNASARAGASTTPSVDQLADAQRAQDEQQRIIDEKSRADRAKRAAAAAAQADAAQRAAQARHFQSAAQLAAEAARKAADAKAEQEAEAKARSSSPSSGSSSSPTVAAPASCSSYSGNRKTGCALLISYGGFGVDQMGCLDKLWTRESGWNEKASNPSSGAYGIPQALPGSKMATIAGDWETNPATQVKWGLDYIKDRYSSPCGAWAHSESNGWY